MLSNVKDIDNLVLRIITCSAKVGKFSDLPTSINMFNARQQFSTYIRKSKTKEAFREYFDQLQ